MSQRNARGRKHRRGLLAARCRHDAPSSARNRSVDGRAHWTTIRATRADRAPAAAHRVMPIRRSARAARQRTRSRCVAGCARNARGRARARARPGAAGEGRRAATARSASAAARSSAGHCARSSAVSGRTAVVRAGERRRRARARARRAATVVDAPVVDGDREIVGEEIRRRESRNR